MLRSLLEVLAQKFIGWGLANPQLTCNLKHISHACKSVGLLDFLVVTLGFGLMTMSWSVWDTYPEVYEASMNLGQVDLAFTKAFLRICYAAIYWCANCSWKIMEDWGNMLGNLLARFTCSTSLVILVCVGVFSIVHDLSEHVCVQKSGAQVFWGQSM
jgi:hypothetical protein